jgi:hypothetical protein
MGVGFARFPDGALVKRAETLLGVTAIAVTFAAVFNPSASSSSSSGTGVADFLSTAVMSSRFVLLC